MTRTVFTICSANYLATAKVLMDTLRRHEPDTRRVLVLAERSPTPAQITGMQELLACEVLPAADLGIPTLDRMAFQYDITEFNTALKPYVFQHLFAQGDTAVLYLDPDISVYQPLTALWTVLETEDAVVTPHITAPLPDDGLAPSTENMLRCGQYNFGFVGLAQREPAQAFLVWWAERLAEHCVFHHQHFYFVDQFYGALLSSVVPRTRVWPHQGYNYAYWNASQRSLSRSADGQWDTPDGPLVFFHFSGFVQDDPAALSRHQNRVRAEPGSALETIAIEYADCITANRELVAAYLQAYSYGHYHQGTRIDALERQAYRDLSITEKEALGDPFDIAIREHLGTYLLIDDANGSAAGMRWELWQHQQQSQAQVQDLQHQNQDLQNQNQDLHSQVAQLDQTQYRLQADLDTEREKYLNAEQHIQRIMASPSYRVGRALTAPLRLGRQHLGSVGRRSRTLASQIGSYQRQHGWRKMAEAGVRVLRQEGLGGLLRRLRPAPPQAPAMTEHTQRPVLPLIAHTESVDIIVCIHNALDDVRRCLDSVLRHTAPPYRLILVDDGSQDETRDYVQEFAESQGLTRLRNDEAKGYTLAASQGLRASSSEFVVLLNSDTIVPPQWMDRLLRCFRSDPKIGVVGPLSNTASWQSVPQIFDDKGDWYDNPLPEGRSVADMAAQVAALSTCQYPRVGFINGFCYMIRRQVIEQIGVFDEETFARGFGEEDDYSLRATQAGWQLAVADDAYVFHAQSRSYTTERRLKLAKLSGEALVNKHGGERIGQQVEITRYHPALAAMRARLAECWTRADVLAEGLVRHEGRRLMFLLPITTSGGGGNVVIQEARAMQQMGVDVCLVNLTAYQASFQQHHPDLGIPVHFIDTPQGLDALLPEADAVVATQYSTVKWLADSLQRTGNQQVVQGYYIQDFEPSFFKPNSPEYRQALASYTLLPDLCRITKTQWNRQETLRQCQVDSVVVGCSYNDQLFIPSLPKQKHAPVRVLAMVRPSTPRRAPELTLQVLKTLRQTLGEQVLVSIFGAAPNCPMLARLDTDFEHRNLGELTSEGVAQALDETDVFLDLSTYQAMGLTALEAMACGVAVVVPQQGGAGEFVEHEESGLVVDTSSAAACVQAAQRLLTDHDLRLRLQANAMAQAPKHTPALVAARILDTLFVPAS